MKTLRLTISALTLLATAACGATEVTSNPPDSFESEPEPTPEATPEATPPVPVNERPFVPEMTLSTTSVKALETVLVDLTLADPDADELVSECSAFLTSENPEFEIASAVEKLSETQWRFTAPITQSEIGTAVVRCSAVDPDGERSDLAESMAITIDNRVDLADPNDPTHTKFNICRVAPQFCTMVIDDLLNVRVIDPQTRVPDQVRGVRVEIPHTDFTSIVDLSIGMDVAKKAIYDEENPSIQVTVGADAAGYGYILQLTPYATDTYASLKGMNVAWRWEVRALTPDGMTAANLFAGQLLASGSLGYTAPQQVEASVQDGLLSFTINGNVQTPAIAATNVSGSIIGLSARSMDVSFVAPMATLKP